MHWFHSPATCGIVDVSSGRNEPSIAWGRIETGADELMSEQLIPSELPWIASSFDEESAEDDESISRDDSRAFTQLLAASPDEMTDVVEEMSTEEIVGHLQRAGQTIRQQEAKFASLQEISSAIGATIQLDELLGLIMDKITGLMDAERSSLFLLDEETGQLWSRVSQGVEEREIRVDIGEGIAGWVAETGRSVNISDAYDDDRFNPEYDRQTGYRTQSVLCQCVRNQEGEIIGVVEVLNAKSGEFTKADEHLLSTIASQAAVAIENSQLYLSAIETNTELRETKNQLEQRVAELDLLYDVEQELSQAHNLETLIETITKKTLELIRAEASALLLKQDDGSQHYVLVDRSRGVGEHDWDFSVQKLDAERGIAARAMQRGEPVICGGGDCDPVPDSTSEAMGLPVENAIAVPLFDEDECIGSLKVANRLPAPEDSRPGDALGGFTEDDEKVLTLIAGQIAVAVSAQRHREEREKRRRLASIGQALSGVLHDLKNPAALISGYVQLMVKADSRETREQYADLIDEQFEQFNQMTRELLTFARGESHVELEEVDLDQFADDIGKLLDEELTGRDIELDIDLSLPEDEPVRIDAPKVKRALLNLARNAVEAMEDDGGRLSIRSSLNDEGDLVLNVRDTGEGIPPEIRNSLFEAFETEGKRHGTGLGLAIVKKVVEDHGGTIDFETETGKGTLFTIVLPQDVSEEQLQSSSEGEVQATRQPA